MDAERTHNSKKYSRWREVRLQDGCRSPSWSRRGRAKTLSPMPNGVNAEVTIQLGESKQADGDAAHLHARPRLSVHPWKLARSRSFARSQLGRDLWRHVPHYSSGRKRRQRRTSINIDPIDFSLLFGAEPWRGGKDQQQQNFLH